RQYEGSGLGLSICRSIVSLMNGTLEVESHPGVGSKFSFEVPLLATPRKDVELYVKVENMLSNSNDRGAILVMSPYIEDYDFVNNFFGTYGVEVMRCRSVEEVEILMASHPRFNIAIIDLTASPDDGITAADMVFGVNPKTRFVFVRGKTLDGPVAAKTGLYSDYMIQRPLSSKTLCNLLGGY
ncbi:MAG: hypothetical protein IIT83_06110, partial [Bacteroidales bacterium]|nr:hypothetical protein [Bacteroidales bacterium]